mgnify:CR=1 FL=1
MWQLTCESLNFEVNGEEESIRNLYKVLCEHYHFANFYLIDHKGNIRNH